MRITACERYFLVRFNNFESYLAESNRRGFGAFYAFVVATHIAWPSFCDEKLAFYEFSEVLVNQASEVAKSLAKLDILSGARRVLV